MSDVEEYKAFSLGFADALITMLGSVEDVTAVPTSAILNYAAGSDPAHTCRDLGVRHVLQGNVQKLGAHWRVSCVCMNLYYEFDPQRDWLEKAEHHCRVAMTLDPALPEAHYARAFILWSPARNFQTAEAIAALEQVLAAQPNNERAHNRMAAICLHIGWLQEARMACEQAKRSNPKTRSNNLQFIYLYSGEFARAEKEAEIWIKDESGHGTER